MYTLNQQCMFTTPCHAVANVLHFIIQKCVSILINRLEKLVADIQDVIQKSDETVLHLDKDSEKTSGYLHVDHFVVSVAPEVARYVHT